MFREVFQSRFRRVCSNEDVNGKGVFIRIYRSENQLLISGRNMRGTPFGGMGNDVVRKVMQQLLCHVQNVFSNTTLRVSTPVEVKVNE